MKKKTTFDQIIPCKTSKMDFVIAIFVHTHTYSFANGNIRSFFSQVFLSENDGKLQVILLSIFKRGNFQRKNTSLFFNGKEMAKKRAKNGQSNTIDQIT